MYIIYSVSIDRFYIVESGNMDFRLGLHQNHNFKKAFTKAASDWESVLSKPCSSRADAVYLESFIKGMKSSNFIEKIIQDPGILDVLISKR
ncbi:MAG: GIY-YIG nuclease family protein [Maribacter sp.]|nr:GIY-YIG nuclease family protein [Maribacter sp.]